LGDENREVPVAPGFLGDVGVEGKATNDEQVKAEALHSLLGGFLDLIGADGAVLGADGDRHPTRSAVGFCVFSGSLDPGASVGFETIELEALVLDGVLDTRLLQILNDHGLELTGARLILGFASRSVHVGTDDAVG
jgi:hypothetical protein